MLINYGDWGAGVREVQRGLGRCRGDIQCNSFVHIGLEVPGVHPPDDLSDALLKEAMQVAWMWAGAEQGSVVCIQADAAFHLGQVVDVQGEKKRA